MLQFERRIWPRIEIVNEKNAMNLNASPCFMAEVENYARLPGMEDKELRRFADRIAGQLLQNYDRYCEEFLAANDGDNSLLLSNGVQAVFYGRIARMARAFNITPMHWRKYCKGKLTRLRLLPVCHGWLTRSGGNAVERSAHAGVRRY